MEMNQKPLDQYPKKKDKTLNSGPVKMLMGLKRKRN